VLVENHNTVGNVYDDAKRLAEAESALTKAAVIVRDRALLLIGFAGAFPRAELDSLDEVSDLAFGTGGAPVLQDRSGRVGAQVGIPCGRRLETCPRGRCRREESNSVPMVRRPPPRGSRIDASWRWVI
jgi:hypothetical protein